MAPHSSAARDLLTGRVSVRALVAALGLPPSGKTLAIGTEPDTLAPITSFMRGVHLLVRLGPAKKGLLKRSSAGEIVGSDAFNVALPADIDLCAVNIGLARTPDVFEELLGDRIHAALACDGIVVLPFVRDATDTALDALRIVDKRARENLQSFMRAHFDALTIDDAAPLQAFFKRNRGFAFLGWAPFTKRDVAKDAAAWLILRKRAAAHAPFGMPRSPRVDQFPKSDFEMFLRALKDKDVKLLPARRFARRYKLYSSRPMRRKGPARFGHAKFDIHGNMRRPLEIARIMHDVGYPGLFLMMQKHPINQGFFDAEETWDTLREMRDMGHEIGLHADVFHFIRVYGDLYKGMDAALEHMRKRGFKVRSMSLHGDSTAHIKSQRLHATDFFKPSFRRKIWEDFGVEFFSEVAFARKGRRIARASMLNVTDNGRSLEVCNVARQVKRFSGPTPFRIDAAWTREAAEILAQRPFVMLTHPQWYW
jgi:hypothetical protein